jgi:putative membrane protein
MIDYDPHTWRRHFFDIKGSMVRQIIYRVLLLVIWSAGVVAFDKYVRDVEYEATVHSLIGFSLGLLLVFRTNASYERFWEGRKLWGSMVNESRNLARVSASLLRDVPDLQARVVRWCIAFSHATMTHLRQKKGDVRTVSLGPVANELPPEEVAEVLASQHVPNAVADKITRAVDEARRRGVISDILFQSLDQDVQQLTDYMGGCERIHKTPLPFAYVVHLRRALILYCFTLPFGLIKFFGWGTIGATFVIAYIFFGIEEIGVEIEDPFGGDDNDLPLESICETIRRNLLTLIPKA